MSFFSSRDLFVFFLGPSSTCAGCSVVAGISFSIVIKIGSLDCLLFGSRNDRSVY